ncbi:hypothetical protein SAMN05428988_6306 [Chitinophaga sp. YR573]|nr:hypothetical protein SAMN05428988_6306 [Chitinophaga sp. YR573]
MVQLEVANRHRFPTHHLCFNSSMVQLEDIHCIKLNRIIDRFNSSMVQLEDFITALILLSQMEFQFLYGTIGSH